MIMHVLQTAYVTRTGRGAPWQLAPVDLLTGTPTWFYPSGVHLLAAATAGLTGGAVVPALNAQTVVLLAAAGCTGAAALGAVAGRQLGLGRGSAMLVAGVASLVMAGLYRPAPVLMHDGGILANAVVAVAGAGRRCRGARARPPAGARRRGGRQQRRRRGVVPPERGGVDRRDDGRVVGRDAGRRPRAQGAAPRRPGCRRRRGRRSGAARTRCEPGPGPVGEDGELAARHRARPVLPGARRDPRLSVLRRDRPGAEPRPDLGAAARARRDRRRGRAAPRSRAGGGVRGVERDRRRRLGQPGDGRRRPGHAVLLPRDAAHLVARLPARAGAGGARRGAGREPGGRARPPPSRLGGPRTRPPPRSPPTRPGRRSGTPGSSNSRSLRATAHPTSSGSVPTTTRRSPGWPRTSGRGSGSSTPRTTARPTSTSSAASRSSTSTPSA